MRQQIETIILAIGATIIISLMIRMLHDIHEIEEANIERSDKVITIIEELRRIEHL